MGGNNKNPSGNVLVATPRANNLYLWKNCIKWVYPEMQIQPANVPAKKNNNIVSIVTI